MVGPHSPISRRQALGVLATPLLTPILASCGADALFSPERADFAAADTLSATLIGAGDPHAKVNIWAAQQTGAMIQKMLGSNPGSMAFVVGDCTEHGTAEEFQLYDKTWGAFKARTLFQIGNHDLNTDPAGTPYYNYTGALAGARGKGYYAKTFGAWRCYFLNSQAGRDEQTAWLTGDLPKWNNYHIMAMWHQPMFASVCAHNRRAMTYPSALGKWWKPLQDHGAELVVSGHVHRYERLARLLRDGTPSAQGIRQFVVGTGGAGPMDILTLNPHCEYHMVARGIFKLGLYSNRYDWQFTDLGGVVRDTGSQACRRVLA
jgi:acid phosphatase type 7